ncbi:VanZ family protein [Aggregatilinea lenta]|uniref:VanZ family protein n=1 Tax=Aggregatilinea lenta TaxID=913108 RepID=UPI000E5B6349|nr:VanZ family protein [Aggregatilinea lenta]
MTHHERITIPGWLRRWGPALAIMALLFVSSSQPKIEQPGAETVYFSGAMPIFPGGWDFIVKKSGHMLAYGLLAALLCRALWRPGAGRSAGLGALAGTMLYAVSDELHQTLVRGRHASATDLGFDFVGAALAILLVWIVMRWRAPQPAGQRR